MTLRNLLLSVTFVILLTLNALAQSSFVYTNNVLQPNSVSGFSVGANGALSTLAGSPFSTGSSGASFGNDIEVSSDGNFLAASNDRAPSVSIFSINHDTGELTLVPGSPFTTNTGVVGGLSIEFTPDNRFLLAANNSNGRIAVFSVASNGALTPVAGSPFIASNNSIGPIKVSSNGQFLFVALNFSSRIAVLSIDPNGALTPVTGSPFLVGEDDIASIDINCDGTLLFTASEFREALVFNISSGGALTQVSGSPFQISNFAGHQEVLLNPSGNILFASNKGAATVSAFSVSPTGGLTLIPGSTVFIGDSSNEDRVPIDITINQAGTLLYVMNADSTIHVLNIAASGLLTLVPGSPFINPAGSGFGTPIIAFPPRTCAAAPAFDMCIQDERTDSILKINTATGAYQFSNCGGFTMDGTGTLRVHGCNLDLNDSRSDRKLDVKINTCAKNAKASLKILTSGAKFSIKDKDTTNNTCTCS